MSGLWFFLQGNLASFWQGELLWHRQPLASPATDLIYTLLTLALPASALPVLIRRSMSATTTPRAALGFAFAGLAALFAFFALLSVKYDFQDCFYPSRAQPFFISGRRLLGALIPVMIRLATGLNFALKPFAARTKLAALAALVLLMLGSEIATDWNIFPNEYNWFHL
ncbi:MAG TPA: hypothetical protein VF492_04965 [Verrucomicrobiae bacterium]